MLQDQDPSREDGVDPLDELRGELGGIAHYAQLYVSARRDLFYAYGRKIGLIAAAVLFAVPVVVGVLVTAAVLFVRGLAELSARLIGASTSAGFLLTGGAILVLAAVAIALGAVMIQRHAYRQALQKYRSEERALEQAQQTATRH